jgi:hypothetical protein
MTATPVPRGLWCGKEKTNCVISSAGGPSRTNHPVIGGRGRSLIDLEVLTDASPWESAEAPIRCPSATDLLEVPSHGTLLEALGPGPRAA